MDNLRESWIKQGLTEEAIKVMLAAERPATAKARESTWRKFRSFCGEKKMCTKKTKEKRTAIIEFLLEEKRKGRAYSTLMQYATDINTTFTQLNEKSLAKDPTLKRIQKGLKETTTLRRKHKDIWDLKTVLNTLKEWGPEPSFYHLTLRTTFLIAICTMWRPRSDLARLVCITDKGESMELTAERTKEAMEKTAIIDQYDDTDLCPVRNLRKYIEETKEARNTIKGSGIILTLNKKGTASGDTIARWITKVLKKAGVWTVHTTPHTTRSVSSSMALRSGSSLEAVLKQANWKSAQTFKKYYYKEEIWKCPKIDQRTLLGATKDQSELRLNAAKLSEE